jgi:shikimate dehydrogenase
MRWLDDVTPEARAIGAVNTIVREIDRMVGHNTDAGGLMRSLDEADVELEHARAVVLGAGGAARAAVVGLASRGVRQIVVAARRVEQAEQLVSQVAAICGNSALEVSDLSRESLSIHFREATLLVQSTSATLANSSDASDFAAQLALDALPGEAAVVDLVYKPRETTVLARAKERGLKTVDGLGMLLHQGALAFELWTHLPAPLEVMRQVLES